MHLYAGIDIGTTNSKALIVTEEGKIIGKEGFQTPTVMRDGHLYFDLGKIEKAVDYVISEAGSKLAAVGFSSVGESAVPISEEGLPLDNPPMWNDTEITSSEEERRIIRKHAGFHNLGIRGNGLLTLDKILWLRKRYPEIYGRTVKYLPISSYMAFRKTGVDAWDYSQAVRSEVFDPHNRAWIEELLSEFSLTGFGSLKQMGSYVGTDDEGIVYGLGGHDHITGLYGVYCAGRPGEAFFYESMGTSAVLALVVPKKECEIPSLNEYNPPEGSFIPGFSQSSFILTRSFRQFGRLNSMWMNLSGLGTDGNSYRQVNEEIMRREYRGLSFLAESDSDFIRGNTGDGVLNFHRFNPSSDIVDLIESTYLYLSVGAAHLERALREAVGLEGDYAYYAGGAVTEDEVFMRFRATALSHPIYCLKTGEISAAGAVFAGMNARGDAGAMEAFSESLKNEMRVIEPDEKLFPIVEDARKEYSDFAKTIKSGGRV